MLTAEAEARAVLIARGAPPQFADAVYIRACENKPETWFDRIVTLALVIGAFGLDYALFLAFQAVVDGAAEARAAAMDASLVHVNVGFGWLIQFFGAIFGAGYLAAVLESPEARRATTAHVLLTGLIPSTGKLGAPTYRVVAAAASDATSADDFLDRVARANRQWLPYAAAPLLLIGALVATMESQSYWVASSEQLELHRFWPPFTVSHYRWPDAARVTLGCNDSDEGGDIVYKVGFRDGMEFGLGDARPRSGALVATLETIDARLPDHAPRQRWSWLDREPMAERCLATWSMSIEDGRSRVRRLLRAD